MNIMRTCAAAECDPSGLSVLECKMTICDCFEHQRMHIFLGWYGPPSKGINAPDTEAGPPSDGPASAAHDSC